MHYAKPNNTRSNEFCLVLKFVSSTCLDEDCNRATDEIHTSDGEQLLVFCSSEFHATTPCVCRFEVIAARGLTERLEVAAWASGKS